MAPTNTSIADTLKDLWALLKAYGKQETIDPLKVLGRYLGFGIGGAILLTMGGFFGALALLRFLQTMTGDLFADTWSFVPYFIVIVPLVGIVIWAATRINKGLHATYLSDTGMPTAHDPDPAHHSTPVNRAEPLPDDDPAGPHTGRTDQP